MSTARHGALSAHEREKSHANDALSSRPAPGAPCYAYAAMAASAHKRYASRRVQKSSECAISSASVSSDAMSMLSFAHPVKNQPTRNSSPVCKSPSTPTSPLTTSISDAAVDAAGLSMAQLSAAIDAVVYIRRVVVFRYAAEPCRRVQR